MKVYADDVLIATNETRDEVWTGPAAPEIDAMIRREVDAAASRSEYVPIASLLIVDKLERMGFRVDASAEEDAKLDPKADY